ncbi:MAG: arginine N-succinyltransferase [Deltaproteobacteria bacterium]|nr:arginine N-succinyltransferase [Deltaproteobacteria bacterium]
MSGYLYREVHPDDLEGVVRLAAHLDSLNLPADADAIAAMIEASVSSFGRNDPDDRTGRFLFVLERTSDRVLLGTSMIVASHGTTADPHHAFRVDVEERYSESLGELFAHQTLTLVQSYRPHTELGALVLHPDFRGHPDRLGQGLSFVRFLYMALQPGRFHDRVEAELLPPLEADGSSLLWEWVGRPFTRLSYRDADRLSRGNREFIRSLFPRTPIHTALAPAEVQAVIGAVGVQTRGVARMLTAAGFRFNLHIDPFDGGPHFDAKRADILPLQQACTLPFAGLTSADDAPKRLITRVGDGPFRAALGSWRETGDGALVDAVTATQLNLQAGDLLLSLPLTSPRKHETPR